MTRMRAIAATRLRYFIASGGFGVPNSAGSFDDID